jgi:hypothetical protein
MCKIAIMDTHFVLMLICVSKVTKMYKIATMDKHFH